MEYSKNTQRLRDLMAKYDTSAAQVGKLLNRSAQTVRVWRSKNPQDINDTLLELLEFKLAVSPKAK